MNRRYFISSTSLVACLPMLASFSFNQKGIGFYIKPIVGPWLEFKHHNQVGAKYWNQPLPKFTAEQWKTLIYNVPRN